MTDAMHGKPADRPSPDAAVIKLSRSDVEAAKRLLSLVASADKKIVIEPPAAEAIASASDSRPLQRRAREILANRRRRYDIFGRAMFSEPAWEILLLLYTVESGPRQTISGLAELSGASKSTALRWIDYLEGQRLVRRESHPTDRRSALVELSDRGKEAIELYLSDTLSVKD